MHYDFVHKWVAGIQRGSFWVPFASSPAFDTEHDAIAWIRDYLAAHPETLERGLTGMGPRRVEYAVRVD